MRLEAKTRRPLRGQNATIYRLLADRPRTNGELSRYSLKYTSRISDIRNWLDLNGGGSIECKKISGGTTLYTMRRPRA